MILMFFKDLVNGFLLRLNYLFSTRIETFVAVIAAFGCLLCYVCVNECIYTYMYCMYAYKYVWCMSLIVIGYISY